MWNSSSSCPEVRALHTSTDSAEVSTLLFRTCYKSVMFPQNSVADILVISTLEFHDRNFKGVTVTLNYSGPNLIWLVSLDEEETKT